MIPISTFNLFIGIVIVLLLYSFVDSRNKIYGNIAAIILGTLIGAILAIVMYIGAVASDTGVPINDLPTAAILLLVSVLSGAYAVFIIMDAKEEYDMAQEQL